MSEALHALLRARVTQHLTRLRPPVGGEYGEAGARAIEEVRAGRGNSVITLPTGQARRASEVIGLLLLDSFLLEA